MPAIERPSRHILWSASLPPTPLGARVEVAAAAGFDALSVSPNDVAELEQLGVGPDHARRLAEDAGVELAMLDAFTDWYPFPPPRRRLDAGGLDLDRFLDAAVTLGVRAVTALAPYPTDAAHGRVVEGFATFCDRAARHDLGVNLEFTPFPPVSSLAAAWEVVLLADRPNAAITVDAWHFFRSDPDLAVLRSIPPGRVTALQLGDGGTEIRESLLKDTFRHRLLPGDGVFDLAGLVAPVLGAGHPVLVGPEVLSEELFALTPDAAARRLAEASSRFLHSLGRPPAARARP
jgi:sugar phosphate isomerase/epimerase